MKKLLLQPISRLGLSTVALFAAVSQATAGTPPTVGTTTIQRLDDTWANPYTPIFNYRVGNKVRISNTTSDPDGALEWHNILVYRPSLTGETTRLESTSNPFLDNLPTSDPDYRPTGHADTIADKYYDVFGHQISNYQIASAAGWNHLAWSEPANSSFLLYSSVDFGNRLPFLKQLSVPVPSSSRSVDIVLDAPGQWSFVGTGTDADGNSIGTVLNVTVENQPLITQGPQLYRFDRINKDDYLVGTYYSSGQALGTYPVQGKWVRAWRFDSGLFDPKWGAHQLFPMIPSDDTVSSVLSHDNYSSEYHRRTAWRLMEVGIDFVAFDFSNLSTEDPTTGGAKQQLKALGNVFKGFNQAARNGHQVRVTVMLGIASSWNGTGYATKVSHFNDIVTELYNNYAQDPNAWLEIDGKPLLLLYSGQEGPWLDSTASPIGPPTSASPSPSNEGVNDPTKEGTLTAGYMGQLQVNGTTPIALDSAFTIRYVGSLLTTTSAPLNQNQSRYTNTISSTGDLYVKTGHWTYLDYDDTLLGSVQPANVPSPATNAPSTYECVTVRPRFDVGGGVAVRSMTAFSSALTAAMSRNPRFLMFLSWNEFGNPQDEPDADQSWTLGDNNKHGSSYGDRMRYLLSTYK